ncbi:MAG: acetaldehyde dehydrogenase (acetylating) [Gammaproteobacteria bacterium]|nr:acetaldehyde dehydrogenase (acetylating) [Gammaproteobacteria bacterium]
MSVPAVIIGSGNIGTDLMIKIGRSDAISLSAMVGVDSNSEGLALARNAGIPTTSRGIDGFLDMLEATETKIAFDASSATFHARHSHLLNQRGIRVVDLTPAAVGPLVVPHINLDQHLDAHNVNLITCGGQATIPIVSAISQVTAVHYAEIVASVSSRSAGPGTRANIDEFTQTTKRGIELVGRAREAKAIIILNPAEPPMLMRDTIFALTDIVDQSAIATSISKMVDAMKKYVPGYRLKQEVQFDKISDAPMLKNQNGEFVTGLKTTVFIEVEGAGDYLPVYAGNLDIMTSAALSTGERIAQQLLTQG